MTWEKKIILIPLCLFFYSCVSKEQVTETKKRLHQINSAQDYLDSELVYLADSVRSGKLNDELNIAERLHNIAVLKSENMRKHDSLNKYLKWQEYYLK